MAFAGLRIIGNACLQPPRTRGAGQRGLFKLVALLSILFAFQLYPYHALAQSKEVVAAVPSSFPPYYQLDSRGQPTGFAIEIMDEIARQAGIRIRYEAKGSWTAVFNAVRSGEVDLIPNVGATKARESFLAFTIPVETFAISIFTRKSTSEIKGGDDLKGRNVGAVKANIGLKIAKKLPGLKVTAFSSFEQAIFALFSGRIDALIYPDSVAWKLATEAGYQARLRVAGEPLREIKRVIGVRKGDKDLHATLNDAARIFVSTVRYREIYRDWFAEAPPFWTTERIAWTLGGGLIALLVLLALWRHYSIVAIKEDLDRQVDERTAELRESEVRNRLILETAGEGIYGLDEKGIATFVNPAACEMLGYRPDQLIGRPMLDLVHHSHPDGSPYPKETSPIFASIGDGTSQTVSDEVMWRMDGTAIPVKYTTKPVPPENEIDRAVVSFSDITEIKRRELALKRSNVELEHFAYAASHDLQEPLRKIQTFSERLQEVYAEQLDERGVSYIERVVSSAIRMRQLIEDLLSFSRVTTDAKPMIPTNLNEIARGVINDLEITISEAGADIVVKPLPTIDADPVQMRQVFQNFISNSIKFRQEDRPLVVEISETGMKTDSIGDYMNGKCAITIRDNGIGFDAKYADQIFGVFERLHGRTEFPGTGIGLATCKKVIERHGGSIGAQGTPGVGAIFTLTLPIHHREI